MRFWIAAAWLVAPLPLLAAAGHELAAHAGRELGSSAAAIARQLAPPARIDPPLVVLVPEIDAVQAAPPASERVAPAKAAFARRVPSEPARGVYVPAETVLRLANAGNRPSGAFVAARGERPAGIALAGVGGLGIGLVDGDILTHAGGRPARSAGDVIGVVIASRAARAQAISGRFWRAGHYYNLVVEQPYLEQRTSERRARARVAMTPGRAR